MNIIGSRKAAIIFVMIAGCSRQSHVTKTVDSSTDAPPVAQTLFDLAVRDVLTNPELQESRDFYGTSGDSNAILRVWTQDKLKAPLVPGWNLVLVDDYPPDDPESNRVLGLRLDKLDHSCPAISRTVSIG